MLDEISALEKDGDDKKCKKYINEMVQHTVKQLFGEAARSKIKRPQVKATGPLGKFFTQQKKNDPEKKRELQAQLAEAKKKCTECKGYDDDKISCVQRDCPNLFKLAILSKDIEEYV